MGVLGLHILRWREEVASIDSIEGLYTAIKNTRNLDGPGDPERVGTVRLTSGFFDLLGVKPQLGRWSTRAEEERGAPDVSIISDSTLAAAIFPPIPTSLAATSSLMASLTWWPASRLRICTFFRGHQLDRLRMMPERTDSFIPYPIQTGGVGRERAKPGVCLSRPSETQHFASAGSYRTYRKHGRLRTEHPEIMDLHPVVEPLETTLVGDTRRALLVMLGAVALVLLIVCANVTNLMLGRSASRSREMAIRAALGASRRHLLVHSLAESMLLGVSGRQPGFSWRHGL